jgi:CheY-like chemotaxis protein
MDSQIQISPTMSEVAGTSTDSCAPQGWRRLRVLCVDDHEDSLHVLKRLLALQRHDVRTCGTVAEARAALASAPPSPPSPPGAGGAAPPFDLLICDLMLPDGDGHQLMREAAGLGIPGIALTALTGQRNRDRSRADGFLDHLDKPILYEQLSAAIERVMSREPGAEPPR